MLLLLQYFERAKHTLDLFNLKKDIPIIIDERIRERDMEIYENVSFDDLNLEEFWGIESETMYTNLESMKAVYERVSELLNELKNEDKNKNVLLVTHGGIARAIYWYFNGFDSSIFQCENCRIYEYNI